MIIMYKCLDCGFDFEEPKRYSEDYTPGGAFEGGSFMRYFEGCPICAGAFEEATECECGEYFIGYEEKCENCLELEAEEAEL